ncbi:helix-turn-helix domain-containing protein [Peribacillus loiseleuriae]|uniref:helix-turn-helix domain-containing protein n=1 Tax=Peribacillus loiseleuriae TaxID=1679170 RepID=UPI003CFFC522
MAKLNFRLISSIPAEDEKEATIKEYHSYWRKTNTNSNAGFVPVFKSFRDKHLATLEPGALRLYLFFAFAADNNYGNSWYSIEKIAEFFDAQTRTVNNWIKVLVDKNLIIREQKGKKSFTTYLVPYSNSIIKHQLKRNIKEDKQDVLDMFMKKLTDYESLYGPLVEVFHFFQWKTDKKKPIQESVQWLFAITKRDDGILTGHNFTLRNSNHLAVDEMVIPDNGDIATFNSPFKFNGENIKGLVLTHEIRLQNNTIGSLLKLMEDLAKAEAWDWDEHPKLQYGELSEFFPVDETEAETDSEEKKTE